MIAQAASSTGSEALCLLQFAPLSEEHRRQAVKLSDLLDISEQKAVSLLMDASKQVGNVVLCCLLALY